MGLFAHKHRHPRAEGDPSRKIIENNSFFDLDSRLRGNDNSNFIADHDLNNEAGNIIIFIMSSQNSHKFD